MHFNNWHLNALSLTAIAPKFTFHVKAATDLNLHFTYATEIKSEI